MVILPTFIVALQARVLYITHLLHLTSTALFRILSRNRYRNR